MPCLLCGDRRPADKTHCSSEWCPLIADYIKEFQNNKENKMNVETNAISNQMAEAAVAADALVAAEAGELPAFLKRTEGDKEELGAIQTPEDAGANAQPIQ